MKILELRVMRGPNYWSNYRKKIIVAKLDLEELEYEPTNKLDGFTDRLKALMPSLEDHHCSEGHKGGFFERLEQGTWMGHVVEHIALEIQTIAGMDCGYGRTRSTNTPGVYFVVFSYKIEEVGRYAIEAAVRIADALAKGKSYDLRKDIRFLEKLYYRHRLGPSIQSIVDEALKKNIPYKRSDNSPLIVLGFGVKQQKIKASMVGTTKGLSIQLARDKQSTKSLLENEFIPVPEGILVYDEKDVERFIGDLEFPLVMKPVSGNQGYGITTGIGNLRDALNAFKIAADVSVPVIMEEFIEGDDYRLVIVNYKFIAAARRIRAMIYGDGVSTIEELIEQVNADPARKEDNDGSLSKIRMDEETDEILASRGLKPESVLPNGERLFLKYTPNINTGGTSEDVTDQVHPHNIFLAERVARIIGLDICGVDIIAKDISKPLTNNNGAIIEVNAGPGLRMHHHPAKGLARNLAKPIVDMLFPGVDDGRIPIVAITGTNGKTTTTRMIAHLARYVGKFNVGYTTSDGIYINGNAIHEGDCTGPVSTETILFDPTVNFAVLECARGGILRSGLAFDHCDISVVTNITEDHLGLKEIYTLEEMARVKEVVPRTTKREGYAILNADDDLVYDMKDELTCRIALFSMNESNERIKRHCINDGLAAVIENDYLTVYDGKWKYRIDKIENIPVTLGGRADSMIKNLLPAALAAFILKFNVNDIRLALGSFIPSADQTPGRMNIFKFKKFEVMIDYAHNIDGFVELKKFLSKVKASSKIGIIAVAGDRREEDIRKIGSLSAEMFDEIIIRHDKDLRGRAMENMNNLLMEGISQVNSSIPVKIIPDEIEAIKYSLNIAPKHAFVTVCSDDISNTITFLTKEVQHEKEMDESRTTKT